MSNLSPDQPSPYSAAPEPAGNASKSGSVVVLVLGLVAGVVFLLLVCGGMAVALLLPAVSNARLAAQQVSEQNNLKMVGIGLHNYHATYKQLPSTALTDADGNVVSTWRTAVVPFLDGGAQVNASPGDAAPFPFLPVNSTLANETNVFAIVSPNGMFSSEPNASVCFSDVADGLSKTVMAVKLPNRAVDWSSTEELTPDMAFGAIQSIQKPEAGFWLMGDGRVARIELPLDRKTFDALISRDGGEPVSFP